MKFLWDRFFCSQILRFLCRTSKVPVFWAFLFLNVFCFPIKVWEYKTQLKQVRRRSYVIVGQFWIISVVSEAHVIDTSSYGFPVCCKIIVLSLNCVGTKAGNLDVNFIFSTVWGPPPLYFLWEHGLVALFLTIPVPSLVYLGCLLSACCCKTVHKIVYFVFTLNLFF